MKNGATGDRLVALFLLGVLLLMPPAMAIFNIGRLVFGIPVLFLYLFSVWIVLVGGTALVLRSRPRNGSGGAPPAEG